MARIKISILRTVCCLMVASLPWSLAKASEPRGDAYPQRAIRIVVGFGPGTAIDTVTRMFGEHLSAATHRPVIIDNKPGANSAIAADHVARAPGDGYTLLMASNTSHAANPSLMKKLTYDPVDDFAPVGRVGQIAFILAAGPTVSAGTVAELITETRRKPGGYTYASSNSGSIVAGALFSQAANLNLRHVPYKSSPQAISDVVAGHVDLIFVDPLAAGPQLLSGRLKALGVTSSSRLAHLPEVPSLVPQLSGTPLVAWYALFAPKATSPVIVESLNRELQRFLGDEAVAAKLSRLGVLPWPSDPQTLGAFVQREIKTWGEIVRKAGIQPE